MKKIKYIFITLVAFLLFSGVSAKSCSKLTKTSDIKLPSKASANMMCIYELATNDSKKTGGNLSCDAANGTGIKNFVFNLQGDGNSQLYVCANDKCGLIENFDKEFKPDSSNRDRARISFQQNNIIFGNFKLKSTGDVLYSPVCNFDEEESSSKKKNTDVSNPDHLRRLVPDSNENALASGQNIFDKGCPSYIGLLYDDNGNYMRLTMFDGELAKRDGDKAITAKLVTSTYEYASVFEKYNLANLYSDNSVQFPATFQNLDEVNAQGLGLIYVDTDTTDPGGPYMLPQSLDFSEKNSIDYKLFTSQEKYSAYKDTELKGCNTTANAAFSLSKAVSQNNFNKSENKQTGTGVTTISKSCTYYYGLQATELCCNAENLTVNYNFVIENGKINSSASSVSVSGTTNITDTGLSYARDAITYYAMNTKKDLVNDFFTISNSNDIAGTFKCGTGLYIHRPNGTATSDDAIFPEHSGVYQGIDKNKDFVQLKAKEKDACYFMPSGYESCYKEKQTVDPYDGEEIPYICVDHTNDVACGALYNIPKAIPKYTALLLNLVKIFTPIVLIIKGLIDLFKSIAASRDEEIEKARKKFFKRLIPAVIVFMTILLAQTVFKIVGTSEESGTITSCISCFLNNRCQSNNTDEIKDKNAAYCAAMKGETIAVNQNSTNHGSGNSGNGGNSGNSGNGGKQIAVKGAATDTTVNTNNYPKPLKYNKKDSSTKSISGCTDRSVFNGVTVEEARIGLASALSNETTGRGKAVAAANYLATNFPNLPYSWGGTSYSAINSNWGKCKQTYCGGSHDTACTYQPYGMDCSGFVSWAVRQAGYTKTGTSGYWGLVSDDRPIAESNKKVITGQNSAYLESLGAKVGDLVWHSGHIGIIIGKNSKGFIIAHEKGYNYTDAKNNGLVKEYLDENIAPRGKGFTHVILMDDYYKD